VGAGVGRAHGDFARPLHVGTVIQMQQHPLADPVPQPLPEIEAPADRLTVHRDQVLPHPHRLAHHRRRPVRHQFRDAQVPGARLLGGIKPQAEVAVVAAFIAAPRAQV